MKAETLLPANDRQYPHPQRLERSVSVVLLRVLMLALVGIAVGVGTVVVRNIQFAQMQTDVAVLDALATAHAGMLDQETGLRAYVETRDRTFLEPYRRGMREETQGDALLDRLLSGDSKLNRAYVQLRLAQEAWTLNWALGARDNPPKGNLVAFLSGGKHLFDHYRSTYTALNAKLGEQLDDIESSAVEVAYLGLALEIVLAVLILVTWYRSRRRLQLSIVDPVTHILESLDRISDGDFTHPKPVVGAPAELDAVGRRVAQMAESLVEYRAALLQREEMAQLQAKRLRQIVEMGHNIAGSLNLRYVMETVAANAISVAGDCRCIIWLLDFERMGLRPAYDTLGLKGETGALEPATLGHGTAGKAAKFGRCIGPEPDPHVADARWSLALPMIVGARVVGVVQLVAGETIDLEDGTIEVLDTLATHAATATEAARLYEAAERQGLTDPLTQLPNRRQFDADLAREFRRAQRYGLQLAFAMIDVDHFKQFNDERGHQVGDVILQEVAATLAEGVRSMDSVYRYGGEEFALIFPESSTMEAATVCERLRAAVTARFAEPADTVTVSAGVASYPMHGMEARDIIHAADQALYAAKRGGRNRVELAPDPASTVLSLDPPAGLIAS